MEQLPFFSILIPTRNRPDMLRLVLLSLSYQSFKDFEVIISDNSDPKIQEKNLATVKKFRSLNINYIRPPQALNMHDNWEFGFSFAKGNYHGVAIDKTFLKSNALFELHEILIKQPQTDLINYLHTGVEHYPNNLFKFRRITKTLKLSQELVESYSAEQELERKFNFEKNIRSDFTEEEIRFYNFGKACFGFYSKELVQKIKKQCGRVFSMLSCDYTSSALALYFAKHPIIYNKELLLCICNFKGNGHLGETQPGKLLEFLKTCDPSLKFLNDLPIPGLYCTLSNLIAYDYQVIQRNNLPSPQVNLKNLTERCAEDLLVVPFSSPQEKEEQTKILQEFAQKIGIPLTNVKNVRENKTPTFTQKLYRYFFEKSLDQKWKAIKKRMTCELKFVSLKSLLTE